MKGFGFGVMHVEQRLPTVEEYKGLRLSVGWDIPDDKALGRTLANSLYSVVAEHNGSLVGLGRVVGGGGSFPFFCRAHGGKGPGGLLCCIWLCGSGGARTRNVSDHALTISISPNRGGEGSLA